MTDTHLYQCCKCLKVYQEEGVVPIPNSTVKPCTCGYTLHKVLTPEEAFKKAHPKQHKAMESVVSRVRPAIEKHMEECVFSAINGRDIDTRDIHQAPLLKRIKELEEENKKLLWNETWHNKGHKVADGFLDKPSESHIVDKICIIGWQRDEAREKLEKIHKALGLPPEKE